MGRPVAGEDGRGGRESARRHFTGNSDCEFFEVEFGISEGIDYIDGSTAAARWTGQTRPSLSQSRPRTLSTRSIRIRLDRGGYTSKLDDWGNTTLGRTEDKETLNGKGDGSGQRDEHELGQR